MIQPFTNQQPPTMDKIETKLIEFVKLNDFIYNKASPDFKCARLKQQKWHEFAKTVGCDVEQLKKRWKTLRDSFYRELKRIKKDRLITESRWRHFDRLMFLKDVKRGIKHFETDDTIAYPEETASSDHHHIIPDKDLGNWCSPESKFLAPNVPDNKKLDTSENDYQEQDDDAIIHNANERFEKVMELAAHSFVKQSSIQTFFNAMAQQVEEACLPVESWFRLQSHIMQLVQQEIRTEKQLN